jgi:hypothetical protein
VEQIREAAPTALETIKTLDDRCAAIYREDPFHESPDLTAMLRRLLAVRSCDERRDGARGLPRSRHWCKQRDRASGGIGAPRVGRDRPGYSSEAVTVVRLTVSPRMTVAEMPPWERCGSYRNRSPNRRRFSGMFCRWNIDFHETSLVSR